MDIFLMKINSIWQGFLCLTTEHELFDGHQLGVNSDACFAYQQSLPVDLFI